MATQRRAAKKKPAKKKPAKKKPAKKKPAKKKPAKKKPAKKKPAKKKPAKKKPAKKKPAKKKPAKKKPAKKKPAKKKPAKKKPARPLVINLWARVHGPLRDIVKDTVSIVAEAGLGLPDRYSIPFQANKERTGDVLEAIAKMKKRDRAVRLRWGNSQALIYRGPDDPESDAAHVDLSDLRSEAPAKRVRLFNRCCWAVLEAFFESGQLVSADHRPAYMAETVPEAPCTNHNAYAALVTTKEVKRAYADPDVFWSKWDTRITKGSRHLVARALEHVEGAGLFKRLQVDQWELARAAKPGLTKYYPADLNESEMRLFRAGRAKLSDVGYSESEDTYELTCVLEEGERIPPWQLYLVWEAIQQKQTRTGQSFETLRVVFLDEWAARQEMRPLLDIGAKVFFYDAANKLRELR